ncbi:hypothetical protein [Streptomyces uncialis]|uniref:hypothetical protein n=1 Tax=Streptomyces uncialis TaxID=1048205 RepID=UPI0022581529|nr:hypothetical protein [Streptomyces uncialis]MCX4661612.1 hypothetical protein [Streptomyces uncialis]
MAERIEARTERRAPGFRFLITARHILAPSALQSPHPGERPRPGPHSREPPPLMGPLPSQAVRRSFRNCGGHSDRVGQGATSAADQHDTAFQIGQIVLLVAIGAVVAVVVNSATGPPRPPEQHPTNSTAPGWRGRPRVPGHRGAIASMVCNPGDRPRGTAELVPCVSGRGRRGCAVVFGAAALGFFGLVFEEDGHSAERDVAAAVRQPSVVR